MLVSHRRRFIYLKTRKTAGTSVEILFERECAPEHDYPGASHSRESLATESGVIGARMVGAKRADLEWPPHINAAALRGKIGSGIWDAYLKFCTIRNPFDKVVSLWWMTLDESRRHGTAAAPFTAVRAAFNDWAVSAKQLYPDRDICMIDGEICIDRFLRYEQLWPDIDALCGDLGVKRRPSELGRYKGDNRRRSEPYAAYYGPEAAARVADVFAWQCERFGYALGFSR